LIKSSAAKEIEAVDAKSEPQRILARIWALAREPRAQGSETLAGHADRYRVRQGKYRIIDLIDDHRTEVTIVKVGHRKDVYR
jgi:mRNA interferase RelE/StbE